MSLPISNKALLTAMSLLLLLPPVALGYLKVNYQKSSIKKTTGDKLSLICTAVYDEKTCVHLDAYWCQYFSSDNCTELADLGQYLTTVQESDGEDGRHRKIVTEFKHLTQSDTRIFQCRAVCPHGETSMGHFITLSVGAAKKTSEQGDANGRGEHRTCGISVMLCSLMLTMNLSRF